jgi:hypothetical protein
VGDVLGIGPDAAEDAEHWLDEAVSNSNRVPFP